MDKLDVIAHESPAGLAAVQAWRARGAEPADPVRFRFIEALARRAALQPAPVRQRLDARVIALLAACEAAAPGELQADPGPAPAPPAAPTPGPLAALTATLTQRGAARARSEAAPGLPPSLVGPAELASAQYFRSTWSRLSAHKRLTQSLAKQPDNAGPLNSHRLIHRALSVMRELSPAYLQRFMAHVDTLMWMEQMQASAAPASKDAAKGKAGKAGTRPAIKTATKTATKTVKKTTRGKAA